MRGCDCPVRWSRSLVAVCDLLPVSGLCSEVDSLKIRIGTQTGRALPVPAGSSGAWVEPRRGGLVLELWRSCSLPSSAMTAGTMVMQCPGQQVPWTTWWGGACAARTGGKRGPLAAGCGSWSSPCPRHDRRGDPSCGGAATRRLPIGLPAHRSGNPAAGPLVTYLSSVVLVSGCCLPVRQDRHVRRRHQPASQATRSPAGACRSRADGVLARELGSCAPARPRHSPSTSRPPPRAPSSPMPFRNRRPARPESGQPGRQETAVIARGDRRGERTGGSCEVQGSCGVPTSGVPGPGHCTRVDSPICWTTGCSPRQGPRRDQAGDRRRRLTAPLTWVPEAEPASRACDA
jgi:hypothetical protein